MLHSLATSWPKKFILYYKCNKNSTPKYPSLGLTVTPKHDIFTQMATITVESFKFVLANYGRFWVFCYFGGSNFVDVSVFSFSKTIALSKLVSVEDVNLQGRATHKYNENWATMNCIDSTVMRYSMHYVFHVKIKHDWRVEC